MNWNFSIALIFALLLFSVDSCVIAQPSKSPKPSPMDKEGVMYIQLSKGLSVITDTSKTLYIDYRGGTLYHKLKNQGECNAFDIKMVQGDGFVAAQIDIYGELQVIEENDAQSTEPLITYKVMKAPRALLTRGAGNSSLHYFGVDFYPGFTHYFVDQNYDDYKQILHIADYNKHSVEYNPLIEQLDPSLLVQRFAGVPLEKREKDGTTKFNYTIKKEKTLRDRLNSQCF